MKKKKLIFRAVKIAVMVLLSLVMLGLIVPIYFVIIRSFAPLEDMFPMNLLPEEPVLKHFSQLFSGDDEFGLPFSRYFFNTFAVSAITIVLQVYISAAMAYVLSKTKAPGVKIFNRIIEWTLILSPTVLYVPQYIFLMKIGLSDSIFAMISPIVVSPLAVFLMKKYMDAFSDDIIDSAKIDGASHFRICFGIVMPNIKSAWISLIVLVLVNSSIASGELIVRSPDVKPLGALFSEFAKSGETAGMFCALAVIISVPLVFLAVFFRKEILHTISFAGIKVETNSCGAEKK